jgi:hypothetical protein
LYCIKSPNQRSLIMKLKIIISPLSEFESELFMIPFYGDPLTPHMGCIQTTITSTVVTENVCMSRRWKDDSVAYGIYKQPSLRFMHLLPLKSDHSSVYLVCLENFQHLILTSKSRNFQTVHQNRPYE